MDDNDKGILEKFTDTVKSVVETASIAAKDALKPDPDKVVATANEQVSVPEATDAAAIPPSVFSTRKRAALSKASTKRVNKRVAKKAAAKKAAAKAPAKKSKKAAKKTTKAAAAKKTKRAKKSAPKKSTKRAVAKKAAPTNSNKGKKSKRGRSQD